MSCAGPAWGQTIGSACTAAGASANAILLSGRYTDLICDGSTYQERRSVTTGSSATAAKTFVKIDVDTAGCSAVKTGRLNYYPASNTLCYCSGQDWVKISGVGCNNNPADANFSSVVFLMKTNNVNGAANNIFSDSSTNNFTVTRTGSVPQGAVTPFPGQGGSGYFGGAGNFLSIPASSTLNFGTGSFTIQGWFNVTSLDDRTLIGRKNLFNDGTNGDGWVIRVTPSGEINWSDGINSGGTDVITSGAGIAASIWYHFAVTRSGTTLRIFVNGVQKATATSTNNYNNSTYTVELGRWANNTSVYPMLGYLSNIELANTARYTSNFTSPTAPLTADGNTLFLAKFANGAIYDAARKNNIDTLSTATISTAQTKFGDASVKFNGTSDYLSVSSNSNFDFGTGDFTVESWIYLTSYPSNYNGNNVGAIISRNNDSGGYHFSVEGSSNSSTRLYFYDGSSVYESTITTLNLNTWYHVAFSRSGSTLLYFINGTQVGSSSNSTNLANSNNVTLGRSENTTYLYYFPGYLYDTRVTKGVARYTTNFTAPSTTFAVQ